MIDDLHLTQQSRPWASLRALMAASCAILILLGAAGCAGSPHDSNNSPKPAAESASNRKVEIPDVGSWTTGKDVSSVSSRLEKVGFTNIRLEDDHGNDLGRASIEQYAKYQVTSTTPQAGKRVNPDSVLYLNVEKIDTHDGADADDAAPVGTTVQVSSTDGTQYEVAFGSVTWNADATIHAFNQYNEPAPAGEQYAIVPATIKNTGHIRTEARTSGV